MRLALQTKFNGVWNSPKTVEFEKDVPEIRRGHAGDTRGSGSMVRWKKPTKDEILENRRALADRARHAELVLPDAVSEIRRGIGMTQEEFAKTLGLTRRQVAEIEVGASNPTLKTLQKIGRLFGFKVGFVQKQIG
jgi:DNA-binding XRE family transcriptional regulator